LGIYLIPIHYFVLILLTLKHFSKFLSFLTSSLHGSMLSKWWLKIIHLKITYHFLFPTAYPLWLTCFNKVFFYITTFINAFQTLLHVGTGIFKPGYFYCKSEFWQWIIQYSNLSVTFSFNLHYSFTTHSPLILEYYGGITVVLR